VIFVDTNVVSESLRIAPDVHVMKWLEKRDAELALATEEAALAYGEIMGQAARRGHAMATQDGMIAAIARVHAGALATRNVSDFRGVGVELIDPWTG